ncbi:alkaline phosphatase family protein [Roseiconus lacunae]|uniref:alkaline phosphatase family protein n=1 Tax=Roseiconus lacunae TaxID=2605694 RepID=UPI003090C362|nr:alkaline phosphatase family protein [Stieleria sp. HD01]
MTTRTVLSALALFVFVGTPSIAQDAPKSRVLVIGVDGVRADALKAAKTPAIDALIENGIFAETTKILGDRYQDNDTVSGPGWSSFLTGVWADKHGVHDNSFENRNYKDYPHFFVRLKEKFPDAMTASFVDWKPIDQYIVSGADIRKVYSAEGADGYAEQDEVIATDACELLQHQNPHAVVVYFGAIDETGHRYGFHPSVTPYVAAIEKVDSQIRRLIATLKSREQFTDENWLVIISTDHGGRGLGHGSGHRVPEINTTFLVVSGESAQKGSLDKATYVVDVAPTALSHLGVKIDPQWKLDGSPVGLIHHHQQ